MKITVNPSINTPYELNAWPINIGGDEEEPERVSVDTEELSYALVFEGNEVRIEVWTLDCGGELEDLKYSQVLPKFVSLSRLAGFFEDPKNGTGRSASVTFQKEFLIKSIGDIPA